MNHFCNKKFNLIKFGKGAITVSSLALPTLISANTNAMIKQPKYISRLFVTLSREISSSSSSKNISTLKTSTTPSTGISNPTTLISSLTGDDYKKFASINNGGNSLIVKNRIKDFDFPSTSTTSNTNSLTLTKKFISPSTTPSTNVSFLIKKFNDSSSTNTPYSSNLSKTPIPNGKVASLRKMFSK